MNPAILMAIGAGLCWGVGELFTKSVLHTKQIGPITAVAVRTTVALPILWGAYWYFVVHRGLEPRGWWKIGDTAAGGAAVPTLLKLVLGSGVIAGAIALIFFYAALNLAEVSRIKPIAFALAPAVAVVLGWLVMGEAMTVKKAVAVMLILSGVVMLTGK